MYNANSAQAPKIWFTKKIFSVICTIHNVVTTMHYVICILNNSFNVVRIQKKVFVL